MGKPRKTAAAEGHHPFVGWLDEEIRLQGLTEQRVSKESGLGTNLVRSWRLGGTPNIANFDAALNLLGYRLAIVDKENEAYDNGE